ncbi:MAG: glycosyl transferase [Proteobacteria bacterium SG_bin9]|nr:MAG: glycosyl transferase [Proteobacteria bacterium SG_bin9]
MPPSLAAAFSTASSRLSPRAMPLVSIAIYLTVFGLWFALLSRAITSDTIFAWSVGLFYIAYDTALLLLIARLTWPAVAASWQSQAASAQAHISAIEASISPATRPSLGVVIAAYNEATVLPETLAALCRQTDLPDLILVVDDGSTDETARVLAERFRLQIAPQGEISAPSETFPLLRVMRLPRSGKAEALNAAIVELDTDIVVAIDADTALAGDAIAAIRNAFAADPSLVAGGGLLAPVCDPGPLGRVLQWFQTYEYIRSMVARFAWMRAECLVLISGAFSAFRREALVRVGGFDTDSVVEDYELTHRLHRYSIEHGFGWRLQMIPGARAATHAPGAFGAFLMQRRRWFAGYLQVQLWNRDIAGQRKFGSLGAMMMPIKAFDTLQPIYGFSAFLLLVAFLIAGKVSIVLTALTIIAAKIAFDLLFNLWMVYVYRRVTGDRRSSRYGHVIIASVLEPFSFQLLRQAGATWGWISFLTNRHRWGAQNRTTLGAAASPGAPASQPR